MKTKITRKAVREIYDNIICVGYCNLQYLLARETEMYYCTRVEGWACDVYDFGNTAIITGYDPFGNIRPSYELQCKYNKDAEKIIFDYSIKWETQREMLRKKIDEFINECIKEQKGKRR